MTWPAACDAHTYLVTHVRWLRYWRDLVASEIEAHEAVPVQLDLLGGPEPEHPERGRLAQVLRSDAGSLRRRQERTAVAVLRWVAERPEATT